MAETVTGAEIAVDDEAAAGSEAFQVGNAGRTCDRVEDDVEGLLRESVTQDHLVVAELGGVLRSGLAAHHAHDASGMIATLSEQGQEVLDRAYQEVIVLERALTEAFTPAEADVFCELLERATGILIQQTP